MQISSAAQMDDGLLPNMRPGTVWIDLSTNDLDTAQMLAEAAAERGITLIGAPVSGGPGGRRRPLSVYVGGPEQAVIDLMPVFKAIGANVDHLGPHGAGVRRQNCPGHALLHPDHHVRRSTDARRQGRVDPAKMTELIQKSAGRSYVADVYGPEIVAGTYDESFSIALAAKDMRLAMEMASTMDADLPFMARVAERYAAAEATMDQLRHICWPPR